jgi:DNA-binding HxlR family transcriptional regulator
MADGPRGRRVRGSRTGRPIMAVLDLLGRRWMLRILWQLRDGPLTFRALRASCDACSPSVLNTRLAEMRAAGLVESRADEGYVLTGEGEQLLAVLAPLHGWAARWAAGGAARIAALSSRAAAPGAASRPRAAPRPRRAR